MKKLMIAVAIVCAAAMSQASQWNWSVIGMPATSQVWNDKASGTTLYSTTPAAAIYLFDAAVLSQDQLLAALRDDGEISKLSSVGTTTLADTSKMNAKTITSYGGTEGVYNFYMAVIDANGDLFLSASQSGTATALEKGADLKFTGLATATANDYTSDIAFTFGGEGGKGTGWYSVQSIPEPTSGLLLLLGVAGLALRRRRA